jgi:hypothetical protein
MIAAITAKVAMFSNADVKTVELGGTDDFFEKGFGFYQKSMYT